MTHKHRILATLTRADLVLVRPGARAKPRAADRYRVAARETDVFGNDSIAAVDVEVK